MGSLDNRGGVRERHAGGEQVSGYVKGHEWRANKEKEEEEEEEAVCLYNKALRVVHKKKEINDDIQECDAKVPCTLGARCRCHSRRD